MNVLDATPATPPDIIALQISKEEPDGGIGGGAKSDPIQTKRFLEYKKKIIINKSSVQHTSILQEVPSIHLVNYRKFCNEIQKVILPHTLDTVSVCAKLLALGMDTTERRAAF